MGGTSKVIDYTSRWLSCRHRYGLDESYVSLHNQSKSLAVKLSQASTLPWIYSCVTLGLGFDSEITFQSLRDFDVDFSIHLGPTRFHLTAYYYYEDE